jgi:hypothetical protein
MEELQGSFRMLDHEISQVNLVFQQIKNLLSFFLGKKIVLKFANIKGLVSKPFVN